MAKEIVALVRSDRDSVLAELSVARQELQELEDQTTSIIGKLKSFSSLREVKKRSLDVIPLCNELLQLPVEDILSKTVNETSLSFEPNIKLLKLESKAVNLVWTVTNVPIKKQAPKTGYLIHMGCQGMSNRATYVLFNK